MAYFRTCDKVRWPRMNTPTI